MEEQIFYKKGFIDPFAIKRLEEIKTYNKRVAEGEKIKKELVDLNICPRCNNDLDIERKKWYQFFRYDITKTCSKCGFTHVHNFYRPPIR